MSAPARAYDPDLQARLDRCDREIEEIRNRPDVVAGKCPAWLVVLGIMDWELEKRLIMGELKGKKDKNHMSNKHALDPANVSHPTAAEGAASEESHALAVGSGPAAGAKAAQEQYIGPPSTKLEIEMYGVLFRIVRSSMQGHALGHDVIVAARSIIRRVSPREYDYLLNRRRKAGLPELPEAKS